MEWIVFLNFDFLNEARPSRKKMFKLWMRTRCAFSLQLPSPASAQRHQTPIYFPLQNFAKEKDSQAKIEEIITKLY